MSPRLSCNFFLLFFFSPARCYFLPFSLLSPVIASRTQRLRCRCLLYQNKTLVCSFLEPRPDLFSHLSCQPLRTLPVFCCPSLGRRERKRNKSCHQKHGRHYLDVDLDHTPAHRSACAVSIPKLATPVTGPRSLSNPPRVGQLAPTPPSTAVKLASTRSPGLSLSHPQYPTSYTPPTDLRSEPS